MNYDKIIANVNAVLNEIKSSIQKREFEKAGNVYSFTYNPNGKKKPISVSGHMDTVHTKGFLVILPPELRVTIFTAPVLTIARAT